MDESNIHKVKLNSLKGILKPIEKSIRDLADGRIEEGMLDRFMRATNLTLSDKKKDVWYGYQRYLFKINGCLAWIVEPAKPAVGNPWIWCMEFPDFFTERTGVPELLKKGFYHVHIKVGNTFGSPWALKQFDAFYEVIVKAGLSKKGTLIGISRGGLYAYNWAALNQEKVVCIYGDAPVCDFKSWPAGKGVSAGSEAEWMELIHCYGFKDEAEALAWKKNPVDNLDTLVEAGIPIMHVIGDTDEVVPPAENSDIIEERYQHLGGDFIVIHKPDVGHHPHGLDDPTPIVDFILSNTHDLFGALQKVARWMIDNQIPHRLDANKGRTVNCYAPKSGYFDLTTSWQTGGVCMGLLAMYKRTGEKLYLDRAELAGRYIMSLQVMDQRQERYYGTIRECTPQSLEFCPRDATTAAWALVWLYEATKNTEYLDRAVLFGNWHMKYGMYKGWPLWAVFMDGKFTDYYTRGSFQSGTGLFYHDLFMITGDTRYIEFGMEPIAKNYRDNFFRKDGSIITRRDIFTNKIIESSSETIECQMHEYNDDFGCSMLQAAADLFGDESYRHTAKKFTDWLAGHQDTDGGFSSNGVEIHSSVPIAMMYFDELGNFYDDKKLIAARDKAFKKLLSMQITGSGDVKLDGGFRGMIDDQTDKPLECCVQMRTSIYALIALLKFEGKVSDIWLGKNNRKFVDPLEKMEETPYNFKW